MTVKVRERRYANGKMHYEVDIHVRLHDGRMIRERRKAPATSPSGALKWAKEREVWLIRHGLAPEIPEVTPPAATRAKAPAAPEQEPAHNLSKQIPTLAEFAPRYMRDYVLANRLKPSTATHRRILLDAYLIPTLGRLRLDEIDAAAIQRLKGAYPTQSPRSVNNMLLCLAKLLRCAAEWGVVASAPTRIGLLPKPPRKIRYYDESDFERLVAAAERCDLRSHLIVLLGGEAGLRAGEMRALRWQHIDLRHGTLRVEENLWREHVGSPKGGEPRELLLTNRLRRALAEAKSAGSTHVLRQDDGTPLTKRAVDYWLGKSQRAASLPVVGPHILRHTFCTRLGDRGAPPRAIQALAGHKHASTTDIYTHATRRSVAQAIRMLEPTGSATGAGAERTEGG